MSEPADRLRLAATPGWGLRLRATLVALLVGLLGPLGATAGEPDELPGRVGRLIQVEGSVWVHDPDENAWRAADHNLPVIAGDRLASDDDSKVELRIGSTVLRLGERSEIALLRLDDERIVVRLQRGSLALSVASRERAEEVEVLTDEGRARPLRAGHYRFDRRDETSQAGVWRGELQLSGAGNLRMIDAGDRVSFWRGGRDGLMHTREEIMVHDRFAAWSQQADDRLRRVASPRHVSPEMTGAEELDAYGRWERHPEHGAVWVPGQVPAGWAPYRDGRWVFMRGYGWTWVDAAPWGFAPFHYGRWVSWNGRWCWWPGRDRHRPVYAPALVAWVGGPNVGVSISIGGGSQVGWVPLAPHAPYVWVRPPVRPPVVVVPVYRPVPPGHAPGYRPHPHPQPQPHPRPPPAQVPTGPIMYTDQGVPAGVTAVPSNVFRTQPPVAAAPPAPTMAPVGPAAFERSGTGVEDQHQRRRDERPAPGFGSPAGQHAPLPPVATQREPSRAGPPANAAVPAPPAIRAAPVPQPVIAAPPPRAQEPEAKARTPESRRDPRRREQVQ